MEAVRARVNGWAGSDGKHSRRVAAFAELYPTPAVATRALLRVETLPAKVWEPACGRGHISKVLLSNGHEVVSSDRYAYHHGFGTVYDFLKGDPNFQVPLASDADAVVTNPPYSLIRPFMRRALSLPRTEVYLFQPFNALAVKSNVEVFKHFGYPNRVHLLYPHFDIEVPGGKVRSMFPHAWFVWEAPAFRVLGRAYSELNYICWK